MTHLELHPVVSVRVESTDATLLDDLEAELPAADDPAIGPEYEGPERESDAGNLEDNDELLSARVTYAVGEDAAATSLYDALTGYDLSAATYKIRHYESPIGGVSTDDVRGYYRKHQGERPTDENGEPYVPSSWDPSHHTVDETRG